MSHCNYANKDSMARRIVLCLQYDGSNFCGWQRQKQGLTVQGVLEESISTLDQYLPIKLVAAGRTDSGVHAAGQVAHFDCFGPIPACRWASALNGRLSKDIRVLEAIEMPSDWHACYSAIYRRYRYTIYNGCQPNLFLSPWSWHRYQVKLDTELMQFALQSMIGFYDFSAFQRSGSTRSHAFTTIQDVQIERQGDLINIEIQASGFLYGMVRLLVGQLVALGEHKLTIQCFERLWKDRLRDQVKESAPSKGLCLLRVGYKNQIFSNSSFYDFLPKYSLANIDPPRDPPPF